MTFHFGKWQRMGNTGEEWFESIFCDTAVCSFFNGLKNNTVNITTDGQSKRFAIKAARSGCPFTVKLRSANAHVVVPAPTTLPVFSDTTTLPMNDTNVNISKSEHSVAKAGLGFPWWAILVAVAVLLFAIVTILYFLLVCLMWKRRCCFKNMDRQASANSALPEKSNGPKNKSAQPSNAQANDAQPKGAQPKDGKDKRAPAGHDSSKPKPTARQQEDAMTRQQEDAANGQQEDVLAVLDFDYINIGNVVDLESTSQSHRNTVRAKDDPFKKTHIEPPKVEPQMLQPIIAPEPSFSQALFNGQMSELRPTFFKAFIAATVVYVILVLLILAGWAAAFVMFPDYLGLGWPPVR
ncbi:hypothetical protein AAVH_07751 [Aphelenchoides avenae]|nr:hypothetical protein AAVH_07751 [Aphelenchus avenae]